jgi:hypothetical protein
VWATHCWAVPWIYICMDGSLFWCGQHIFEDCPSTLHTPCICAEYNLSVDMYLPLLFAAVIYLHTKHCNTNCLPRVLMKVTEYKLLQIMRAYCIQKLRVTEVMLPKSPFSSFSSRTRNDFLQIKLEGGGEVSALCTSITGCTEVPTQPCTVYLTNNIFETKQFKMNSSRM